MAIKDSASELLEISTESEESDWDDSDYDMLQETHSKLSNLSLSNKAKARFVEGKGPVTAPSFDEEDFEEVEKIIKAGQLEKLKVDECKLYLRKNGLRLSGNKDTLIQRIKEHLEIINGGEEKYPPSSFVLNCKGDACTGDVVLFEQNVYEMFNIAYRGASGPPCGKRIVAGRIVKESYGAAKQQHTFTIEVLWSKGERPFPPLHPLLIKGRNLYRLKTLRQKWEDEGRRQQILMEKHLRGSVARADREERIQEKEKRKKIMENRVSKKDSVRNQCQSHSRRKMSQHQPQETQISIDPEKPAFPSKNSGLSASTRPAAVTEQCGKSVDSKRVAVGSDQLGRSIDSGKTSFPVHHDYIHNQQAWKRSADYGSSFDIDHISANYICPDFHSREKGTFIEKYHPFTAIHNQQAWKRSADYGSSFDIDHISANYICPDFYSREKGTFIEKYHPFTAETNGFTERTHHRKPLASANHSLPLVPNGESYKQKQLCRHYARGRCYFGDNCKFLHDMRDDIFHLQRERMN